MRLLSSAITAVVVLVLPVCLSQAPRVALLTTGVFHGGEVNEISGDGWLGLAPRNGQIGWYQYAIEVQPAEDPVVDEPGEMTGTEVRVRGPEPVFLVRGLNEPVSVAVYTSVFSPGGLILPTTGPLWLGTGNRGYRLYLTNKRTDREPPSRSALVLESEGVRQEIYTWPAGFVDQHCELIWAGDLDGDGKLDLFMHLSDHYNVIEATLLLSSRAGERELVAPVAAFRTTGC